MSSKEKQKTDPYSCHVSTLTSEIPPEVSQKHPGSYLPPEILTLLFLQQLEAIYDKAQVDSQALCLEPRAQHDKHSVGKEDKTTGTKSC